MPLSSAYGDLCIYNTYPVFISARASTYNSIEIRIYDQFLNPLVLNDVEMSLTLMIQQLIK